jgi:DNA mismatch repair protein MutS
MARLSRGHPHIFSDRQVKHFCIYAKVNPHLAKHRRWPPPGTGCVRLSTDPDMQMDDLHTPENTEPQPAAPLVPAGPMLSGDASPLMAQYLGVKRANPGALLFYRMGDFYELFFDDAVAAAKALDIALTKRGKHQGEDIAMCGVPVHAADAYLARLIRKGFRVAVCEQLEDPAEAKKRGGKSIVKRDVVRLVTPGTLTEDALLDSRRNNFLAAVADAQGSLALAWLDVSTGAFQVQPVSEVSLSASLARIQPGELLLPERLAHLYSRLAEDIAAVTVQPNTLFDSENGRRRLESLFGVKTLDAFGAFGRSDLAAAGALVSYVELTQKGKLPALRPPARLSEGAFLEIDAATRRNLELSMTLTGERAGSLLGTIDRTVTGAGGRLLAERLAQPLTDAEAINRRLDGVAFFIAATNLRERLRESLKRAPDMERSLSRLSVGRGGPRDLAAIRDGLRAAVEAKATLAANTDLGGVPQVVTDAASSLCDPNGIADQLAKALSLELPLNARDGGFIAKGYDAPLDETKTLRDEGRKLIAGLERGYIERTGIAGLRIRHNNVIGYHIEAKPKDGEALLAAKGPNGEERFYIHRQTMANAMRFTTTELADLETKISRAADRALGQEMEIYDRLVALVLAEATPVAAAATALAALDVSAALADLSVEARWARPVVDNSFAFHIEAGRHPVVEAALAREASPFVPNDIDLSGNDAGRLWLVTGPNMAGKSTFLRQNALIVVLAQMGCYVPASVAHIGVVDRLFSRVGAADDLARGRSTFMVEMVETAAILNQAGAKALVILDEIGRGTATFDGLSIAWATVEHLIEVNRCRGLFATHYHELTALAQRLTGLTNHSVRVKEWQDDVVFLHEVVAGTADRSYGIHVAKLAGLPAAVVGRAEEVLSSLENGNQAKAALRLAEDLPLFAAAPVQAAPVSTGPDLLREALSDIEPDGLTPKAALELLYRLKGMA